MTQPTKTPIEPGVVARVAAGLRLAITGKAPDWFGPMDPLPEMVPDEQKQSVIGRQFDFQVGFNTQTRPRTGEAVTFDQMRALADNYDILRLVIETRKDQMEKLKWHIKPKDEKAKPDARCDELTKFFKKPDREHSWKTWLRMLLEDMLVIDAATIYPRQTLGGQLYALEPIDGATIKRVLDDHGRTPLPPDTAYQQILKGVPAINYSRDELLYMPRNPRTNKVYGFSPVEQIIVTINIALRRQADQLGYYVDGNVPNLLFSVPKEWNPDQIKQFQLWWDTVTQGQTKHYGRFIPEGAKPVEIKQPPLKDMYDEWLARVVCFAFSIEPTPFVAQVNRAVADTSRQQSLAEGLDPMKNWVKDMLDTIISDRFGADDLEFGWVDDEITTPKEKADIASIYVNAKIITPDEARADIGKEPLTQEQRDKAWPSPPALGFNEDDPPDDPAPPGKAKKPNYKALPDKEATTKAKKGLRPIDRDRPEIGRAVEEMQKAVAEFLVDQAPKIGAQLSSLMSLEKGVQTDSSRQKAWAYLQSLDLSEWEGFPEIAEPYLAGVAVLGGGEALKQLDFDGDDDVEALMRQRAEAWAKDRAAEMVGMKVVDGELIPNPNAQWQIADGTREWLRGLTEQAIEEGWSAQEMASAIKEDYAFSPERAEMIARTEIAKADISGSVEGWKASGIVSEKEWLTAADCCDECQEMNGEKAPIDGTFKDGKDVPLHPHCRCDVLPVIDDDKDAVAKGFDPDQQRDENGRWSSTGGALSSKAASVKPGCASEKLPAGEIDSQGILKATGHDLTGYKAVADTHAMQHSLKNHGIPAEGKRGQKIIVAEDFGRLPSLIGKPDQVTNLGKTKIGREVIGFEKAMDGWSFRAVMEIRPGRRELALVSLYTISKAKE